MTVEVFTYGNGDNLVAVFDAVAALSATDDMLQLVKIIFMVTSLVVAFEMAFTASFKPTPRVLIFIFLFNALLVPKTSVQVSDRIMPSQSASVDNVPAGIAYLAYFTSQIGDWGTRQFETTFSVPGDLRYQDNGFVFSSRLMEASLQMPLADRWLAANLGEFTQSCIYGGALVGWFEWDELEEADDLWGYIKTDSGGMADSLFTTWYKNNGDPEIIGCNTALGRIDDRWAAAVEKTEKTLANRTFPGMDIDEAVTRLGATLPTSYTYLTGASKQQADLIRQSTMLETMRTSLSGLLARSDSTAAMQSYAVAQAEAQQRMTYRTVADLIGRWLPVIRNVFEALLIGMFPIILLLLLIARDPAKFGIWYVKSLFWVQLWAPMYAILHFVLMKQLALDTAAAASLPGAAGAAQSLLTVGGMRQVSADMSALAGYLTTMVPTLSYAVVMGGGFAMAQAASAIGSVAQSAGGQAAGSASKGNVSMGESSMYNSRMFQQNHSPTLDQGVGQMRNPETGTNIATTAGGVQTMQQLQSSSPLSMSIGSAIRTGVNTQAGHAIEAARTQGMSYVQSMSGTMETMAAFNKKMGSTTGVDNNWSTGEGAAFRKEYGEAQKIAHNFAQKHGLDDKVAVQLMGAASAGVEFNKLAQSIPGIDKLSLDGRWMGESGSSLKDVYEEAKQVAKDSNFSQQWSEAEDAAHKAAASYKESTGKELVEGATGKFQESQQHRHEWSRSRKEAETWQQLKTRMEESGAQWNQQMFDSFKNWMAKNWAGGDMNAVDRLLQDANQNKPGAQEQLNGFINQFVQSELATMKNGIDNAPDATAANNHYTDGLAEEDARQDAMARAAGDSAQGQVRGQAEGSGVPTAQDVEGAAAAQTGKAAARMGETGRDVADGQAHTEGQGALVTATVQEEALRDQSLALRALGNGFDHIAGDLPSWVADGIRRLAGGEATNEQLSPEARAELRGALENVRSGTMSQEEEAALYGLAYGTSTGDGLTEGTQAFINQALDGDSQPGNAGGLSQDAQSVLGRALEQGGFDHASPEARAELEDLAAEGRVDGGLSPEARQALMDGLGGSGASGATYAELWSAANGEGAGAAADSQTGQVPENVRDELQSLTSGDQAEVGSPGGDTLSIEGQEVLQRALDRGRFDGESEGVRAELSELAANGSVAGDLSAETRQALDAGLQQGALGADAAAGGSVSENVRQEFERAAGGREKLDLSDESKAWLRQLVEQEGSLDDVSGETKAELYELAGMTSNNGQNTNR